MNDFELIAYSGQRLTAAQTREEHRRSLAFIEYELLQEVPNTEKVVVTHHVPTFEHYPPKYLGSVLNQGFATDLDNFIEHLKPDYWIYGHHHQNIPDFNIGATQLLTNQLGYVRYDEHRDFSRSKILDTGSALDIQADHRRTRKR